MCRFLAYLGHSLTIDQLLYEPKNSLICQSISAQEREEPLNGDGFGLGWYAREISEDPAVFVSRQPAWSNRNLNHLSRITQTSCVMAHVRAATTGVVSEANCHPFQKEKYLMMHNGAIGGFEVIKRKLRRQLSDTYYHWIQGQTDSEHFFAMFLELLSEKKSENVTSDVIQQVICETIGIVESLQKEMGVKDPNYLNLVVTDGHAMVATRYVSDATLTAESLYYSPGGRYECHDGICRMQETDSGEQAILVVSEKLNDSLSDWKEVPQNHFVVTRTDLTTTIVPLSI